MRKIESQCRVSASVVLEGLQHVTVRVTPSIDANSRTKAIQIRIGRVLVSVEDRDALISVWGAAVQAWQMSETAYGVEP